MTRLHVHLLDLAEVRAVSADAVADLPTADLLAVDRFRGADRRAQAAAARLLTRSALGRALGVPPAAVPVTVDGWGKPRLAGRERFAFAASHDRGLLVLAVGPHPCGIDVEDATEADLAEVRDRFCGPAERRGPARGWWAAKESAAKAIGFGLRAGLASIGFTADPARGWAPTTWKGRRTPLRTRTADLGGRHVALTARGPDPGAAVHTWSPRGRGGRWGLVEDDPPALAATARELRALLT